MMVVTETMRRLLEQLQGLGFWQRIVGWRAIRQQAARALAELQGLETGQAYLKEELERAIQAHQHTQKEQQLLQQTLARKEAEADRLQLQLHDRYALLTQLESKLAAQQTQLSNLQEQRNEVQQQLQQVQDKNQQQVVRLNRLTEEQATARETVSHLTRRNQELGIELATAQQSERLTGEEKDRLTQLNTRLQKEEEFRRQEHSNAMNTLSRIREQLQQDRQQETAALQAAALEKLQLQKATWNRHETMVQQTLKTLCARHTIQYIDKVPFKGEPDNTLFICEEYVILDAKSPAGEDLNNFPAYLKDQSEKARKYAREENVKKDIFFVVPANTLGALSQFVYRLADYTVYIISIDALEPVLLSLQKIEAYEFAEQLSPEDRENICRVLGKFAHLTKRRIQIDQFFMKQFMELAYKCESDLPAEVLEKMIEFEKAEKLNPPTEKRAKQINLKELDKEVTRLEQETAGKGIPSIEQNISNEVNKWPI